MCGQHVVEDTAFLHRRGSLTEPHRKIVPDINTNQAQHFPNWTLSGETCVECVEHSCLFKFYFAPYSHNVILTESECGKLRRASMFLWSWCTHEHWADKSAKSLHRKAKRNRPSTFLSKFFSPDAEYRFPFGIKEQSSFWTNMYAWSHFSTSRTWYKSFVPGWSCPLLVEMHKGTWGASLLCHCCWSFFCLYFHIHKDKPMMSLSFSQCMKTSHLQKRRRFCTATKFNAFCCVAGRFTVQLWSCMVQPAHFSLWSYWTSDFHCHQDWWIIQCMDKSTMFTTFYFHKQFLLFDWIGQLNMGQSTTLLYGLWWRCTSGWAGQSRGRTCFYFWSIVLEFSTSDNHIFCRNFHNSHRIYKKKE